MKKLTEQEKLERITKLVEKPINGKFNHGHQLEGILAIHYNCTLRFKRADGTVKPDFYSNGIKYQVKGYGASFLIPENGNFIQSASIAINAMKADYILVGSSKLGYWLELTKSQFMELLGTYVKEDFSSRNCRQAKVAISWQTWKELAMRFSGCGKKANW